MSQYYKASRDDKEVLVVCELDECDMDNPLTWTDPLRNHRPLFILTNHTRYTLGDEDAEDTAWALLKATAKWDDDWLEEERLMWTDKDGNWSKIPMDRLRSIGTCSFELRLSDGTWDEVDMDDDPHFKWEDNPDYIDTNDGINTIITAADRVGAHVMPVYMYDHSGIYLSLGRDYPFNDIWDSGVLGIMLWTQEQQAAWENGGEPSDARKVMESYFNEYNQYISGKAYCLSVYDPAEELRYLVRKRGECPDNAPLTLDDLNKWDLEFVQRRADMLESCGGFYLDDEYGPVKAAEEHFNLANMEELIS